MPSAAIEINAVVGSNPPNGTALVVGAVVQLSNADTGGELTYLWEWLDRPEGSLSAFSNPAIENPTFTADSEGTYLIKLTVNRTLPDEVVNTEIAAVKQLKSAIRIPAAAETDEESTTRGWAEDVNRAMKMVDTLRGDPGFMTGLSAGVESMGHVLYISGMSTLKAGLPGQELVPTFTSALGSSTTHTDLPLWVFTGKVGGGTSTIANDLLFARMSGVVGPLALGAGVAGDPVYLTDAGIMSTTVGTYARRCGTIVLVSGADYYVHFNGALGHHEGRLWLKAVGGGQSIICRSGSLALTTNDAAGEIAMVNFAGNYWKITATGELTSGANRKIQGVLTPAAATDAANKDYVDSSLAAAYSMIHWGNTDTPNASTECAMDPGFGIRTSPAIAGSYPRLTCPMSGTFSNLCIYAVTGPAGAALDFTLYKNGGATGLVCQLGIGSNDVQDLVNTVTVTTGDELELRLKSAGVVTAGAIDVTATLRFAPA